MKRFVRFFVLGLMLSSLVFSGCDSISGGKDSQSSSGGGNEQTTGGNGTGTQTGKVHSVDLSGLLSSETFKKDTSSGDCYQFVYDVSSAFISLPKNGDAIEYKFNGCFTDDVGTVSITFLDRQADAKMAAITNSVSMDEVQIKAKQEFTIRSKALVTADAMSKVMLQISYSKTNLDKESVFVPNVKTYEINLTDCMPALKIEKPSDSNEYSASFDLTSLVTEKYGSLPTFCDTVHFTLGATCDKDLPQLDVSFSIGTERKETVIANITANEKFVLEETIFIDSKSSGNITVQFLYPDTVFDDTMFIIPEGCKRYKINLTQYLDSAVLLNMWGNQYYHDFEVMNAFEQIPEPGDLIELTFEGTFDIDISELLFYFLDNSQKVNWWKQLSTFESVETIKSGENIVIKCNVGIVYAVVEKIVFRIEHVPDDEALRKTAVFTPKGKEPIHYYEIDFTDYLQAGLFQSLGDEYVYS